MFLARTCPFSCFRDRISSGSGANEFFYVDQTTTYFDAITDLESLLLVHISALMPLFSVINLNVAFLILGFLLDVSISLCFQYFILTSMFDKGTILCKQWHSIRFTLPPLSVKVMRGGNCWKWTIYQGGCCFKRRWRLVENLGGCRAFGYTRVSAIKAMQALPAFSWEGGAREICFSDEEIAHLFLCVS